MRVLIIYGDEKIGKIAEGIAEGLRKNGHRPEVINGMQWDKPISFHKYDLVVAGSSTQGIFRGKISGNLGEILKNCKRTIGQDVVAFNNPRFFATTAALKKVMGELEKQGCVVRNFKSLRNHSQAVEFGKELQEW